MTPIKGQNIVLYATVDGSDYPFACGRNCTLSVQQDMLEVTNYNSARAREFKPNFYQWTVDCDGLIGYDNAQVTYANIIQYLKNAEAISIKFSVDLGALGYDNYTGTAYITSVELSGNVKEIASYSVSLQGSGVLSVTSGLTPGVGGAIVGIYTATGGETSFTPTYTPSWPTGAVAYYVSRGGIQVENILTTGTPTNNDVTVATANGQVTVYSGSPLGPTEFIRVIAQLP